MDERGLNLVGAIFVVVVGAYLLFAIHTNFVGHQVTPDAQSGLVLIVVAAGLLTLGGLGWSLLSDS